MKTNPVSYFMGMALVILGGLFLLGTLTDSSSFWTIAWPIFVFLPGMFFWTIWKSTGETKANWGLLIPATILVVLSAVFFFNSLVTELLHYSTIWGWTVFMYPGAVAIAFWVSWAVTGSRGLLTVAKILAAISIVVLVIVDGAIVLATLLSDQMAGKLWPVLLILAGLIIIFGSSIGKLFWQGGKFMGKSEEEWRVWGESLGKEIGKTTKEGMEEGVEKKK